MDTEKSLKTDWEALRNMTDEEIERNAMDDPDAPLTTEDIWKNARVIMPSPGAKESINIRLEPRVLQFFKADGPGYQKRINAVLEAYVDHETSKTAS